MLLLLEFAGRVRWIAAVVRQRSIVVQSEKLGSRLIHRAVGMSALVQKRPNIAAQRNDAMCHKQTLRLLVE
jgi:hypothetical protein